MAASVLRWEARGIRLGSGVIRYRDEGEGPVLLFVHGILANGTLWREVVPQLSEDFRCIVPDLPLGGHRVPLDLDADLTPRGVARIVADLIEALELRDVTLVGNDTGGAICQVVISEHPERVGGLVLTNCDAYEAFFPMLLRPLQLRGSALWHAVRGPARAGPAGARRPARSVEDRGPRRMDEATLDAYIGPLIRDAGVRRDLARFLGGVSNRYTLEAARSFPGFDRPVLIVWGDRDLFFSPRLALRLQQDFPNARLEAVSGSRAFVPEDGPERLAQLIREFSEQVAEPASVARW